MHFDPMMLDVTIIIFVALIFAYITVRIGQPIVVAYIVTGIILGPSVLAVMGDQDLATRLGEIGVIMLLFFVGMEVSIPRLMQGWKIALIGTGIQILACVGVCVGLTWAFGLPTNLGILFGFVISISSTAVVLKMLQDSGEMDTAFGQNAVGVLLVQDMAIVPMMITLSLIGDSEVSTMALAKQIIGGIAVLGLVVVLMRSGRFHIPDFLKGSLEKRVLLGLLLCMASATLTSWLGLSPGLGAFLAGMLLAASDQSEWVHEHLESVHIIFVAVFFLSVGMMVNIDYLLEHIYVVAGVTLLVFLFNSGVNVFVMRALGESWEMALITGGLLSQIGEFSFLLATVGLHANILDDELHEMTVIVIALTLLLSPIWMALIKRLAYKDGVLPAPD